MRLAIGENIKVIRKSKDITQEQLAEMLGVSCQSVSRWELGVCYPDMELLPALAEIFEVSVDELIQVKTETKENIGKNKVDVIVDTALKGIGVAMGITGTEVSKDAANMILTDDNFSTIVKAVITGRNVYRNIKNSIRYLLSGNFAGILCVLSCSILMLPTPFYPVHLLFMNLITDSLPAIAIGMEASRNDVLKEKPRSSNDSILNKPAFIQIGFEGIVIAISTMIAFMIGLKVNTLNASTMAFATICLARLLHGFNCRGEQKIYKLGFFSNKSSIWAFVIGFTLLHIILFVPFMHELFMIEPVSLQQLLTIYLLSLLPTFIIQLSKK